MERIIINSMKQAEKDAKRRAREQEREYNRQIKAYEKANKEQYIISRYQEADKMTEKLNKEYEKYNNIINGILFEQNFSFNSLKKEYKTTKFISNLSKPLKKSANEIIKVPAESWVEKFWPSLKAKRINLENEKQKLEYELEEKYKKDEEEYSNKLQKEKEKWNNQQDLKKRQIEEHNKKIESWEQGCINCDEKSVIKFIDYIIENKDVSYRTIRGKNIVYNKANKKAIVDLYIEQKENIFKYENFKYLKQKDEIEPVKIKVNSLNQRTRNLLINICIASFINIYKNDVTNSIDELIINIYHNKICCVSGKMSKEEFKNYHFLDEGDIIYIENHLFKIYKQLNTGVKPIEETYAYLS